MKKLLFYLLFIPVIAVSCEEKIDSNYAPLLGKWYYGTDEAETSPETSTIEFTEKYQIIIRDDDLHLILDSGTHFYCTRISR